LVVKTCASAVATSPSVTESRRRTIAHDLECLLIFLRIADKQVVQESAASKLK
jgi:hypothetical protein